MFIFGIKYHLDQPTLKASEHYLMIANHATYLDIILISSLFPCRMVAKKEIKSWPLFGSFSSFAKAIFIDRNPKQSVKVLKDIRKHLNNKENIVVFAEATSNNGLSIKPFKNMVFSTVSKQTKTAILPICIRYTHINNQPISTQDTMDQIAWYDGMIITKHLWQLCKAKRIDVSISVLEPIYPTPQDDRQTLCSQTEQVITKQFQSLAPKDIKV